MFITDKKLDDKLFNLKQELMKIIAESNGNSSIEDLNIRNYVERVEQQTASGLVSTERTINTTLEFIQKDIGETKGVLGAVRDSLREELKDDFVTLRQELELIKKEVDVMVKIVCHMSGAKDSGNSKEHFFDEVLRRLAKLENREDTENGK